MQVMVFTKFGAAKNRTKCKNKSQTGEIIYNID
jgi:hypothetical protein